MSDRAVSVGAKSSSATERQSLPRTPFREVNAWTADEWARMGLNDFVRTRYAQFGFSARPEQQILGPIGGYV